jgi:hypothetical protein
MSKESRHKRWLEKQQKLQAAHAVQRANRRGTMLNPAPDPRDEHAALRALLESPYTALSVAIIFGALALSGKFSVSASQFFFVLAWGVAIIGLRGQPLALFVGLSAIIGGVLVILAYFFRPDVVPSYAGILMPKGDTIFSFNGPALISKIEVGTTGTTFTLSKPGEIGTLLMPFLSESQFKVETVKGKSRISAGITDQSGNIIVELIRNEWKVAPPPGTWDRNYTDDALEVINPQGKIALQVKVLKDRVQLQGEWWGPFLGVAPNRPNAPRGVRIVQVDNINQYTGTIYFLPEEGNAPQIKRMFMYPSELHLGELQQ